MAAATYTFSCVGCNQQSTRHAGKLPEFCEPCAEFRQEWGRMRTPSQWRDRRCKKCHVYLANCIYGARQTCDDCGDAAERRRWNSARQPREHRPGRIICTSCECDLPANEFHEKSKQCRDCRSAWRLHHRAEKGRGSRDVEYRRAIEARRPQVEARQAELQRRKLTRRKIAKCERVGKAWLRSMEVARKPWLADGLSSAERQRLRRKHDPATILRDRTRCRMRRKGIKGYELSRMRQALKSSRANSRRQGLEALLGYTIDALRDHLQRQFTEGMSWQAFGQGRIHIDHIRPLAMFDLTDPLQAHDAWALANLRPLWARDNMCRPRDGSDVITPPGTGPF